MFKLLTALLTVVSISAHAAETIAIQSPYSANHPGHGAMFKIINEANLQQRRYNFILEQKPGGEQLIAIKLMDEQPQNRLAIMAAKYVEHNNSGKLNKDNYVPIWSLGDACWVVISNLGDERKGVASLQGQKELVVGGVGIGNATHITALVMGEKYGFKVRYIPFKTNVDALMLMASDGSVNMAIDRLSNYESMKARNPKLNMLATTCPIRLPSAPQIKTLTEQGIVAPNIFNTIIANKNMFQTRQEDIGKVLTTAAQTVGHAEIQKSSDFLPPQFKSIPVSEYHDSKIKTMEHFLKKYQSQIQVN